MPGGRLDYAVLVALHKESGQAAALIRSLEELEWHYSRKRIFVACEADDIETTRAITHLKLPDDFRLVIVPPGHPRTKPRALNHCLCGLDSDFLVIYYAEDRPHPQ